MTIFIRGKMKRVRRPPMIEGMSPDEFIEANADPIWLHQNELWELMVEERSCDLVLVETEGEPEEQIPEPEERAPKVFIADDEEIPF